MKRGHVSRGWVARRLGLGVLGVVLLMGLAVMVREWCFVDYVAVHHPFPDHPGLVVRRDYRGEGAYRARRSGGRRHSGMDLAAPLGTSVASLWGGHVLSAGQDGGYGLKVDVVHPNGMSTRFAHLQSVSVTTGQRVRQGDDIGTVGKTGNARYEGIEPHLHLEIRVDDDLQNPMTWLSQAATRPPWYRRWFGRSARWGVGAWHSCIQLAIQIRGKSASQHVALETLSL